MTRRMMLTFAFICMAAHAACDRESPKAEPVGPVTVHKSPTTAPTADDVAALKDFVNDGRPTAASPPAPNAARTPPRSPSDSTSGMGIPPPKAPDSELKYDVPAEWVAVKPDSPMRKAQWSLPRAEGDGEDGVVILFFFGAGQGGGVAGNVMRWKGMFTTEGGEPLPDNAVKQESFKTNDLDVTVLELSGRYTESSMRPGAPPAKPKSNHRMIAAIVETDDGSWYFRCTAPAATLAKHEAGIRSLLKSVRN